MGRGWLVFRANVLLSCALHRLTLAKLCHPRLGHPALRAIAGGGGSGGVLDEDCTQLVGEQLSRMEVAAHSRLDTGSYMSLSADLYSLVQGCPVEPSAAAEPSILTPAPGAAATVLLSGLRPHTQFQVVARVFTPLPPPTRGADEGDPGGPAELAEQVWQEQQGSDAVLFWTEQAAWQLLLRAHGLSDRCALCTTLTRPAHVLIAAHPRRLMSVERGVS